MLLNKLQHLVLFSSLTKEAATPTAVVFVLWKLLRWSIKAFLYLHRSFREAIREEIDEFDENRLNMFRKSYPLMGWTIYQLMFIYPEITSVWYEEKHP